MDSAEARQTRRPRQDPEDSSGSRSGSSRRPKKYRNRWLYGVLSCGGLVLIVLMVAIVALQVVYFSKDDGEANKNPDIKDTEGSVNGSEVQMHTPEDSKTVERTTRASTTLLASERSTAFLTSTSSAPETFPSIPDIISNDPPAGRVDEDNEHTGIISGDVGSSTSRGERGPTGPVGPPATEHGYDPEAAFSLAPTEIASVPIPPSSPEIIGIPGVPLIPGMPGMRTVTVHPPGHSGSTVGTTHGNRIPEIELHNPTKDLPTTTKPPSGKSEVNAASSVTALNIRNILLWLILVLFGVGVILVACTVLFVKGYCRTVCPQKGQKFILCACCRKQQDTDDNSSRVGEVTSQRRRIRDEIQMQYITRPRARSHDDSRSGDRESANGTVRSSGGSIETSFQAPPPYCVAMTLPSVPNTDRSQVPNVRMIRTVNPPPAQVILPSYEDVVAEGSALPS